MSLKDFDKVERATNSTGDAIDFLKSAQEISIIGIIGKLKHLLLILNSRSRYTEKPLAAGSGGSGWTGLIVILAGFVTVTSVTLTGYTAGLDQLFFEVINGATPGPLTLVFGIVTLAGEELFWLGIVMLMLLSKKHRKSPLLVLILFSILMSSLAVLSMKTFFFRPRPSLQLDWNVNLPFGAAEGSSYPSGHTTLVFAATGVLGAYLQGGYRLLVLLPIFVGVSRIILGVHFPSDILGGAFLGITISQVLLLVQPKLKKLLTRILS